MEEIKCTEDTPTLPSKRKPEFPVEDLEDRANNKNLKPEKPVDHDSFEERSQNQTLASSGNEKMELEEDHEEKEYEGVEEKEEDEEDDGDEDEAEVNGDAEVDKKGKGIMKDYKGKGKAVAEEDSSDDDDSSDGGGGESSESDLSDDPLAEVDLDNILPSRTRRKVVQPGAYIANDRGVDDDDSDDSDA